jgi:hypothetical protein
VSAGGNFSPVAFSSSGIISTRRQGLSQFTSYTSPPCVWYCVLYVPLIEYTSSLTSSSVMSMISYISAKAW